MIAHLTWLEPPSPLLKGEQNLQKIESLGERFDIFCQKGEINLKRGGGLCRNEGVATFFITLQFNHIYCVWEKSSFLYYILFFSLLIQPCKIIIQVFIVLKHSIICIFLIHSGSVQKLLTALFELVYNTQKTTQTNFVSTEARFFLILKRIWKSNLKCTTILFQYSFLR